jgi:hypothetical protein
MQKPGGSTGVFSTAAYIVRYIPFLRKTGHSSPIGAVTPRGSGLSQSFNPARAPLAGGVFLLFRNRTGYPKLIRQIGFIGGSARCAGPHFVGGVQLFLCVPDCMNKQFGRCLDAVHLQRRMIAQGSTTTQGVLTMHRILIAALGLLGVSVAAVPALAQYYGPGYGYAPGPHYYGTERAYPRYYGAREYYGPRVYRRGYAAIDLTPHYDPRNGGWFCADVRFTVQDGVCKPYRGY